MQSYICISYLKKHSIVDLLYFCIMYYLVVVFIFLVVLVHKREQHIAFRVCNCEIRSCSIVLAVVCKAPQHIACRLL
jgi:hypothetical protein